MRINEFRPASQQEPAENDEEYETDMNDDDNIRQNAIDHVTRSPVGEVNDVAVQFLLVSNTVSNASMKGGRR